MAWESLYDNFIAEYYDASLIVTRRGDLAFYLNLAREFADPVLELACGSGRVTVPVARAGDSRRGHDKSRPPANCCPRNYQRARIRYFSSDVPFAATGTLN